jgi:Flp pilus assembly protein TadG
VERESSRHNYARLGRRAYRGVAIVEFALVFPLLLTVVLSIIQTGLLINAYVSIANAGREGSRAAISYLNASGGDATRREAARVAVYGNTDPTLRAPTGFATAAGDLYPWDASDVQFVSSSPSATNPLRSGEPVTVTVRYRFKLLFGLIPQIPEMDLTARSTMIIE